MSIFKGEDMTDTFRPLRRQNRQISREECIELLQKETRGVLSVNGDDGYPYGMPMNHVYDPSDGCIYFHTGKGGHRADALLRSDKVSFCVWEQGTREEGDWAYHVRSVIVFGHVEQITDMNEIIRVTTALSRKFPCNEDYIKHAIETYGKATLLLRLTPAHMCGKRVTES